MKNQMLMEATEEKKLYTDFFNIGVELKEKLLAIPKEIKDDVAKAVYENDTEKIEVIMYDALVDVIYNFCHSKDTDNINKRINYLAVFHFGGNNSKMAAALSTSEANIRNYRSDKEPRIDRPTILSS